MARVIVESYAKSQAEWDKILGLDLVKDQVRRTGEAVRYVTVNPSHGGISVSVCPPKKTEAMRYAKAAFAAWFIACGVLVWYARGRSK